MEFVKFRQRHLANLIKQLFAASLLCLWVSCSETSPPNAPEKKNPTFIKRPTPPNPVEVFRRLQQKAFRQTLDSLAIEMPAWLKSHSFNPNQVLVADLGLHSGLPRMVVYDVPNKKILDSGLVSHGSGGTGFSRQAVFSNTPNSYCSSLGKYKIGAKYNGQFGEAFKLHGLEPTNNKAYARTIVLHAYGCVPDEPFFPGYICNSQGCPMVSYAFLDRLKIRIAASAKPMLLWIVE